jgi:hypothetical protein
MAIFMAALCEVEISNYFERSKTPIFEMEKIETTDELREYIPHLKRFFVSSEESVRLLFARFDELERQGIDLEEDFELMRLSSIETVGIWEEWLANNRFGDFPLITKFYIISKEILFNYLQNYIEKERDPETGNPKIGSASLCYAFVGLSISRLFVFYYLKAYLPKSPSLIPIQEFVDDEYNSISLDLKRHMWGCHLASDRAEENGYHLTAIELKLSVCEVPTLPRLLGRTEDLCNYMTPLLPPEIMESADFDKTKLPDLSELLRDLDQCHWKLMGGEFSERVEDYRRSQLHRCRGIRGFFQNWIGVFRDETNWNHARAMADKRWFDEGIPPGENFLSQLGPNEKFDGEVGYMVGKSNLDHWGNRES